MGYVIAQPHWSGGERDGLDLETKVFQQDPHESLEVLSPEARELIYQYKIRLEIAKMHQWWNAFNCTRNPQEIKNCIRLTAFFPVQPG